MTIHTDNYEFKLMLEGIKVPFISARVTYSGLISQCQVSLYPSKLFRKIPAGVLVHLFFRKKGTKESFKLLFFGTHNGINKSINGGNRSYSLIAYGRMAVLNNLNVGASVKYASRGVSLTSLRYGDGANKQEIDASDGASRITAAGNLNEGDLVSDSPLPLNNPYNLLQESDTGRDKQNKEEVDADEAKNIAANPVQTIVESATKTNKADIKKVTRAISNPNILSTLIDNIIAEAMLGASEYYNIAYNKRLRLQDALNEFPPTWTNYIDAYVDSHMRRFQNALNRTINSTVGGRSSLTTLIGTILQMFHCDVWEIPGFNEGNILITPTLMQSDIPMCNLIFPSSEGSVNYSNPEGNKVTRIVMHGHPTNERGTIVNDSTSKNKQVINYSVFPDALKITKDFTDKDVHLKRIGTITIKGEETLGARFKLVDFPANYMSNSITASEQEDFNRELFFKIRNAHKGLSIESHFLPNVVPGLKAILMDKHDPLLFRVVSLTHDIGANGGVKTSIVGSEIEDLDEAVIEKPLWYDENYAPDKIHNIYEAYLGCTSMSNSTGKPATDLKGMLAAYEDIFEKYNSSEVKSYLAEKLNTRAFDTEKDVFNSYGITGNQTIETSGDPDTLIYTSEAFDDYIFDPAYDINMKPTTITNERQKPVLNYVKSIYGIIGDIHE